MSKRPGSSRWLQRQQRDLYVRQAQQSHYRSRAVYKLIEIDQRDRLFRKGQTVIDLGAAPGSWSQYASEQVGSQGRVVAVDILAMVPVTNVLFIQGDFIEQAVYDQCLRALNGRNADLVISDLAPNISGVRSTDQARSMALANLVKELAYQVLRPGGDMLIKIFQGEGVADLRRDLQEHFHKVMTRKSGASRNSSREFYILARTYEISP